MEINIPDPSDCVQFERYCSWCDDDGTTTCHLCDDDGNKGRGRNRKPCKVCNGTKKLTCHHCLGTKYSLTPAGEHLLEFLKRRGIG